jgi:hypothetical protein
MKIAELLQEAHIEPKHGEINLGIANGWDEHTRYFMEAIRPHRVDGSSTTRNLGRCYNEYSFTVNDGTDEYNIVYTVDSSD